MQFKRMLSLKDWGPPTPLVYATDTKQPISSGLNMRLPFSFSARVNTLYI